MSGNALPPRQKPEVRGKNRDRPTSLGLTLPRPAVLLPKIGLCSEVSDFSPHFRNTRPYKACSSNISSIRDNIQFSRKRQRAVVGKPNNDPSLSSAHVESTTTVSLRIFSQNAQWPLQELTKSTKKRSDASAPFRKIK